MLKLISKVCVWELERNSSSLERISCLLNFWELTFHARAALSPLERTCQILEYLELLLKLKHSIQRFKVRVFGTKSWKNITQHENIGYLKPVVQNHDLILKLINISNTELSARAQLWSLERPTKLCKSTGYMNFMLEQGVLQNRVRSSVKSAARATVQISTKFLGAKFSCSSESFLPRADRSNSGFQDSKFEFQKCILTCKSLHGHSKLMKIL